MEESYIYDTSRSCSGLLDFGIKELCKNIGRPVYGEVQDTIMVFCQSRNNNLEIFESGSVGLVIAFCQGQSRRILMSILGESHPQGMWQGISFLQVRILGEKNLSQVLLFPKPFSRGLNSKYRERASSCLKESPFEKTNGKYVFPWIVTLSWHQPPAGLLPNDGRCAIPARPQRSSVGYGSLWDSLGKTASDYLDYTVGHIQGNLPYF